MTAATSGIMLAATGIAGWWMMARLEQDGELLRHSWCAFRAGKAARAKYGGTEGDFESVKTSVISNAGRAGNISESGDAYRRNPLAFAGGAKPSRLEFAPEQVSEQEMTGATARDGGKHTPSGTSARGRAHHMPSSGPSITTAGSLALLRSAAIFSAARRRRERADSESNQSIDSEHTTDSEGATSAGEHGRAAERHRRVKRLVADRRRSIDTTFGSTQARSFYGRAAKGSVEPIHEIDEVSLGYEDPLVVTRVGYIAAPGRAASEASERGSCATASPAGSFEAKVSARTTAVELVAMQSNAPAPIPSSQPSPGQNGAGVVASPGRLNQRAGPQRPADRPKAPPRNGIRVGPTVSNPPGRNGSQRAMSWKATGSERQAMVQAARAAHNEFGARGEHEGYALDKKTIHSRAGSMTLKEDTGRASSFCADTPSLSDCAVLCSSIGATCRPSARLEAVSVGGALVGLLIGILAEFFKGVTTVSDAVGDTNTSEENQARSSIAGSDTAGYQIADVLLTLVGLAIAALVHAVSCAAVARILQMHSEAALGVSRQLLQAAAEDDPSEARSLVKRAVLDHQRVRLRVDAFNTYLGFYVTAITMLFVLTTATFVLLAVLEFGYTEDPWLWHDYARGAFAIYSGVPTGSVVIAGARLTTALRTTAQAASALIADDDNEDEDYVVSKLGAQGAAAAVGIGSFSGADSEAGHAGSRDRLTAAYVSQVQTYFTLWLGADQPGAKFLGNVVIEFRLLGRLGYVLLAGLFSAIQLRLRTIE